MVAARFLSWCFLKNRGWCADSRYGQLKQKTMRKIITLLIVLFAVPVFGQNHFIGLKGGINWTNVIADNFLSDNDYRNGFVGGLTYEYEFKKKFHIGLDLVYAQKGFNNDIIFTDENGNPIGEKATSGFYYDYLSLPIKGGFSLGNNFAGFLNLGIVPSLLINAETIIPTDKVTKFDFGGLIEIGRSYKFKERFLLFTSVAYQQSFTVITNEDYFSNGKAKHYGMTLSIGLKYALKKE